jgi:hypothetical protein
MGVHASAKVMTGAQYNDFDGYYFREYIRRRKGEKFNVMNNDIARDTMRTQIHKVATKLRRTAEKIDQGGKQSGLELLPALPRISPQKTDDQIQARTQELISTHLREIARRGLRTDALETVYAINDVTAEMQYQSALLRSAATDLEEGNIDLDEGKSIIGGLCYAMAFNMRRKRNFWSDDPDGSSRGTELQP